MLSGKQKLEWLEYELLESYPHIKHGTFSRHGGVSQGLFTSLNVGDGTSDHADSVKANREILKKMLGVDHVVYPHQTHGINVHRVTAKNLDQQPQADALYTTEKGVGLGVCHADCQAAILYDPVHEAVGVVHCGWRGSKQDIYQRMISTMNREIGTQAHNLIVCISPSLGPDHAEFINYKQELPKEFWEFQIKPTYFDFWAISKMQLEKCGVLPKNIEIAGICTCCTPEDYFSYRRAKETGRNATVVAVAN